MAGKAKFLFDQPFDGTKPRTEGGGMFRPKPPPAKFSLDDMEAAKAQAFAAGEQAGREGAAAEHAAAVEQALTSIEGQLAQLAGNLGQMQAQARTEAVTLAAAIARKLAAQLMAREPLREIETLVLRCMDDMRDEPRLVVRANDGVVRLLDERIDALVAQSGFGGKVMLVPDNGLAASDCRVDWADGSAERNQAQLETDVEQAVQRYLAALQSEAAATEG
jgi:flagellar assembly protein FliH